MARSVATVLLGASMRDLRLTPNGSIDTYTNGEYINMVVPIDEYRTFIPRIIPEEMMSAILNVCMSDDYRNGAILIDIPTKRSSVFYRTLSAAFIRNWYSNIVTNLSIAGNLNVYIGGKMILDYMKNPLLIMGDSYGNNSLEQKVLIDSAVYRNDSNLDSTLKSFIKNTVFKVLAGDFNIEICNIRDYLPQRAERFDDTPEKLFELRKNAENIFA